VRRFDNREEANSRRGKEAMKLELLLIILVGFEDLRLYLPFIMSFGRKNPLSTCQRPAYCPLPYSGARTFLLVIRRIDISSKWIAFAGSHP
jgi:hypothetical protein